MVRWRKLVLAGLVSLGLSAFGCAQIVGFNDYHLGAGGGGTGGKGGGSSVSSSSSSGSGECGVTFPDPPAKATPGGTKEFTVALRSINFGDKGTVGLNLDQRCTCHDAGPSCQSPKMQVICDDDQGRDNQSASFLNTFALILKAANFGSDLYSTKANAGLWSLLLRVRGYNEEPDDAQVEVDVYVSRGFKTNPFSDAGPGPAWDGNDEWIVSSDGLINKDLDQPKYRDQNAYITGSMLVASLPELDLVFAGGGPNTMTMHLMAAGILAKIEQDASKTMYRLTEGQIVGRWRLPDVFAAIGSYRDMNGMGICTSSPFYGTGKSYICNSADILTNPGTPGTPCDALSAGLGFTADPAELPDPKLDGGILTPPPAPPSPCSDGGDPSNDTCPP